MSEINSPAWRAQEKIRRHMLAIGYACFADPNAGTEGSDQTASASGFQLAAPQYEPPYSKQTAQLFHARELMANERVALQDAHNELLQGIYDALGAGDSKRVRGLKLAVVSLKMKAAILGLPLPKPASRLRLTGLNLLVTRLHLRWIKLLQTGHQFLSRLFGSAATSSPQPNHPDLSAQ